MVALRALSDELFLCIQQLLENGEITFHNRVRNGFETAPIPWRYFVVNHMCEGR